MDIHDLKAVEGFDGGRWLYEGDLTLDRTGPFGYTVRVLPHRVGLVSPVEMGLLAVPAPTVGLAEGDLR